MKTSSAKAKGRKLQQEVRDVILESFPKLEPDDVVSTSMGASGTDIKLSPAAKKVFPYSVEAKCQESLSIWAALEQAKRNAGTQTPLLVFKRNRSDTFVAIPLSHFMSLVKKDESKPILLLEDRLSP